MSENESITAYFQSLASITDRTIFFVVFDSIANGTKSNLPSTHAEDKHWCNFIHEASWFPYKAMWILQYYNVYSYSSPADFNAANFELFNEFLAHNCSFNEVITENFLKLLPIAFQPDSIEKNWLERFGTEVLN